MSVLHVAVITAAIAAFLTAIPPASPAAAQSLEEALSSARERSPSLEAARHDLATVKEGLSQARSGFFPQLDATASAGVSNEFTDTQEESFSGNTNASLSLTQPIYRSGGTVASVDLAKFDIDAQAATVRDIEQSVLLETGSAFMDVWRDQRTLDIIDETLEILTTTLQSVNRQQELGASTRTDVAQTEARFAQIQADRIGAETSLAGSRTQFQRLTGILPGLLQLPTPDPALIPANIDDAIALADAGNPALNAATFRKLSAEKAIDQVSANYGPSVDLRTALQYFSDDIQEGGGEIDDNVAIARADVRLTIPLFTGGLASSRVRGARETALAEGHREEDLRTRVISDTRGAWTRLTATRDQIGHLEAAAEAADRSLQGTERENQLGKRTTLDVLNARRDLLDLETTLIAARRDFYVAYFELLALTGRLNADPE